MNRRPNPEEYNPYYETYVGKVGEGAILAILAQQESSMTAFYENLPADKWEYRYETGKWTPKEVLLHVIDAERVFAYRALRVGRADTTPLPGFSQDPYVASSAANERSPESLIAEYRSVRQATLALFNNLPAAAWEQQGTASDSPISVLALAYIIAGHEIHHSQITKERYLS